MAQENPKSDLAAERAELAKLRAELAEERQLLDEEIAQLEKTQQLAAQAPRSRDNRIHQRDLPPEIGDLRGWLLQHGKTGVVRDYEVTLRSGNGPPRVVSPIVAIDEAEAISVAFAQLKIESTQAYNPYARVIPA